LTDLARVQRLGSTTLIMGEINFAWLVVWVLSPDWLSRKKTFGRRLFEAASPGGGVNAGRASDFASYNLAFSLQLRKIEVKPRSEYSKGAQLISAEHDYFGRFGQRGRRPRLP